MLTRCGICVSVCLCIDVCIYLDTHTLSYTHTHTHTHRGYRLSGGRDADALRDRQIVVVGL
jgi:hypothetical protein